MGYKCSKVLKTSTDSKLSESSLASKKKSFPRLDIPAPEYLPDPKPSRSSKFESKENPKVIKIDEPNRTSFEQKREASRPESNKLESATPFDLLLGDTDAEILEFKSNYNQIIEQLQANNIKPDEFRAQLNKIHENITKISKEHKKLSSFEKKETHVNKLLELTTQQKTANEESKAKLDKLLETTTNLEYAEKVKIELERIKQKELDLEKQFREIQEKLNKTKAETLSKISDDLDSRTNLRNLLNTTMKSIHSAMESKILKNVQENEKISQHLDICFMIDVTGSMQSYIDKAKAKITEILHDLETKYSSAKYRIALVAYRDIKDKERFRIKDFTSTSSDIIKELNDLHADGGGDCCEDINGAFQKSLALRWACKARSMIHIADSPCHGERFHKSLLDDYPSGYSEDRDWKCLFQSIVNKGINYVFLSVNKKATDTMVSEFKKIYDAIVKPTDNLSSFQSYEIGDSNVLFYDSIKNSLSDAILKSIHQTFKSNKTPFVNSTRLLKYNAIIKEDAEAEDDEEEINEGPRMNINRLEINMSRNLTLLPFTNQFDTNWISNFSQTIECKTIFFYDNPNTVKEAFKGESSYYKNSVKVTVNPKAFDKGSFSEAYFCKVLVKFQNAEYNMVLKKPIRPEHSIPAFFSSAIKQNQIANFFSSKFNEELEKAGYDKKFRTNFTRVLYVNDYKKNGYILEAFIPGKFEKYSNNYEYLNENVPLLSAFTHFSYQLSEGQCMVTDIQGVNNLLTDPVIHTNCLMFNGHGDMGIKGMTYFFRIHFCNEFCAKLKLKPHKAQENRGSLVPQKRPTTFNVNSYYKTCSYFYCNGNAKEDTQLCEYCISKKIRLDSVSMNK